MSYKLSIPFYGFSIKLHSGQKFSFPLSDHDAFRLTKSSAKLADTYSKVLQKKVMNKGEFLEFMEVIPRGSFERGTVSISFPAAKDQIRYPKFSVEFVYFYSEQKSGLWGIIPTLGLEAFGQDQEELEGRLKEALQFEFTQQRRLAHVQRIVSAIWFREVELFKEEIKLKAPSLKEVDEIIDEKPDRLLPKVAKKLQISKQEAFGRKEEIIQLGSILNSNFQKNALVVGSSGVGKTALIWEIARRKKAFKIKGDIWETTASTLIKELTQNTGWQDNIEFLAQELTKSDDFLFVRNLMELFEVGKYEGNAVSIAEYLKPFLSRGEINLISECTEEEKARIELQSPNYTSNFQVVTLEEPEKELEGIVSKKIASITQAQNVTFSPEAIVESLRLNKRFSPYAGMPGKPIRFLENMLLNKQSEQPLNASIDASDVIQYFCEDTGIPNFIVDPSIPMDVEAIKRNFKAKLFGQELAINQLTDVLAQVKTALSKTGKPIASFLFVGPTGVGKTELAKILAEFMFNSRQKVVRFDMSEFSTPYDIIRLSGLGEQKDGLLTSAILREPFSVILFDEIEKAHSNFYDLLLQILDEGRLSDSRGRLVNFCSSIIIMTSNIGATDFQRDRIGWNNELIHQDVGQLFLSAVQSHFRPELFNRIDQVIPFLPLNKENVKKVVTKEINQLREREGIKYRDVLLNIEEAIYDYLVINGYNEKYGARQMQRTIREKVLTPLAKELNQNVFDEQVIVDIRIVNDEIDVQAKINPLGFDLLIEELELHTNTNHIGILRRHCNQLQEGHYFNHLMSELDILKQQYKDEEQVFWRSPNNQIQLINLTEIKDRVHLLTKTIEKIEVQLGLSCMKLRPYTEKDKTSISQWEEDYLHLKQDIYSIGNPGNDHLYLTLFSTNVELFFKFYKFLLQTKGYQYEMKAIWYSELLPEILSSSEHQEEVQSNRKGSRGFIKTPLESADTDSIPQKSPGSAILCGLELKIDGKCASLFFENEDGFQQWKHSGEQIDFAHIVISQSPEEIPINIHRKDYYARQTMRRIIDLPVIRDLNYKINRETRKQELNDLLKYHMNKTFELKLELEIV